MIQITNLESGYGGRALFENVNINLWPGNRYGIVGANGAGKSTFLGVLTGDISPVSGDVTIANGTNVGTLEQDQFRYDAMNILDVALSGNARLFKAIKEKNKILATGDAVSENDGQRLADIEMIIDEEDGYQAESKAEEILHGLGFAGDVSGIMMNQLSGGYKVRVLLAGCLFSKPHAMLLDEPTNNLDLYSIIWLENFLKEYDGLLVFISHDRRFLNSVATHILDVDYQEIIAYKGNFDQFIEKKAADTVLRLKEQEKQEKEIAHMKKFIERFSAKATKARQANSKKKQLEKYKPIEIKRSSRVSPHFNFGVKTRSGKIALTVKNISKSYGDNAVLSKVSFEIERGQKLGIIGVNGVGKSTLLKIITENLSQDSGTLEPGYAMSAGYFSQNHKDLLPDKSTPYEWLYGSAPGEAVSRVRSLLGQMLLTGDDVNKKISALSGGEATRLILSRLLYRRDNLLILDEPTNHMDMETAESFLKALKKYEGTIIFVSHDRHFTDALADHILELTPTGYEMFAGTYSDYVRVKNADLFDASIKQIAEKTVEPPKKNNADRFAHRKKLGRSQGMAKQAETKIAQYESVIAALEISLSDPDLYAQKDGEKLGELQSALKTKQTKLSQLMVQWEKQQTEIGRLKKILDET